MLSHKRIQVRYLYLAPLSLTKVGRYEYEYKRGTHWMVPRAGRWSIIPTTWPAALMVGS